MKKIILTGMVLFLAACQPEERSQLASNTSDPMNILSSLAAWPPVPEKEIELTDNRFRDNVMLVFDLSGSMNENVCAGSGTKLGTGIEAIEYFLVNTPEELGIGLATFRGNDVSVVSKIGVNNRTAIKDSLNGLSADGGTPLGGAVGQAYYELLEAAQSQQGYGTYRMLIVTDGEAGDRSKLNANIEWIVENTPIEIFTAGFCIDSGHTLNQPGRTEFKLAGNIQELKASMQEVAAEAPAFEPLNSWK